MRQIVLIPAYKPDTVMTDLVFELHTRGMTIVVVDDGSGDVYRALFEQIKPVAYVLSCHENGGKGAALRAGLTFIQGQFQPPYTIVTADADGQHRAEDILKVCDTAAGHPEALVLGCRTISREMPKRSWFGNVYTKAAFLFSTGRWISDTQTGLRGFSDRSLPFLLSMPGERYEFEMNTLLWWVRGGKALMEVPIETVYSEGNLSSHFKTIKDSIIIYWEIIKFSAPSFCCFALDVLLFGLLFFNLPLAFLPRLILSNLLARCISAPLHYLWVALLSRRKPVYRHFSAWRYALIAAAILLLNTLLLWGLLTAGIAPVGAKVLTDILLFFMTFFAQWRWNYTERKIG